MRVNIIVLNYNGEKLIPKCLPSIITAKKASSHEVRITVIDNESTDNSLDVLGRFSEDISVLPLENRILCSFNDAVERQTEEIAILLNNDIRVDEHFIDPLVSVFEEDEDVFMTAPKCFDFEGTSLEGGRTKGFIRFGAFGALAKYKGWKDETDSFDITFQSGFGAVRRDKFLELGGYDDLYRPGRLEDSDICFRAWKKGWKSYYIPGSLVYHMGGESFGKAFGKKGVSEIDSRNSLLFFWKNISDPIYWVQHIFFFPLWLFWWLIRGNRGAVRGSLKAFSRLSEVLKKRGKGSGEKISDRDIFNKFRD